MVTLEEAFSNKTILLENCKTIKINLLKFVFEYFNKLV